MRFDANFDPISTQFFRRPGSFFDAPTSDFTMNLEVSWKFFQLTLEVYGTTDFQTRGSPPKSTILEVTPFSTTSKTLPRFWLVKWHLGPVWMEAFSMVLMAPSASARTGRSDTDSTPIRHRFDTDSVPIRCRFDTDSTPFRYRSDSDSTPIRNRFDVDPTPIRCRFGTASTIPRRFDADSNRCFFSLSPFSLSTVSLSFLFPFLLSLSSFFLFPFFFSFSFSGSEVGC